MNFRLCFLKSSILDHSKSFSYFSSEENSKIDLLDSAEVACKKIDAAVCDCNSNENGVLAFYEHVLFPIVSPKAISVDGKNFEDYADLRDAFNAGRLSEASLKETVKVNFLIKIFKVAFFSKCICL